MKAFLPINYGFSLRLLIERVMKSNKKEDVTTSPSNTPTYKLPLVYINNNQVNDRNLFLNHFSHIS